jgi:hypothetical protein
MKTANQVFAILPDQLYLLRLFTMLGRQSHSCAIIVGWGVFIPKLIEC